MRVPFVVLACSPAISPCYPHEPLPTEIPYVTWAPAHVDLGNVEVGQPTTLAFQATAVYGPQIITAGRFRWAGESIDTSIAPDVVHLAEDQSATVHITLTPTAPGRQEWGYSRAGNCPTAENVRARLEVPMPSIPAPAPIVLGVVRGGDTVDVMVDLVSPTGGPLAVTSATSPTIELNRSPTASTSAATASSPLRVPLSLSFAPEQVREGGTASIDLHWFVRHLTFPVEPPEAPGVLTTVTLSWDPAPADDSGDTGQASP